MQPRNRHASPTTRAIKVIFRGSHWGNWMPYCCCSASVDGERVALSCNAALLCVTCSVLCIGSTDRLCCSRSVVGVSIIMQLRQLCRVPVSGYIYDRISVVPHVRRCVEVTFTDNVHVLTHAHTHEACGVTSSVRALSVTSWESAGFAFGSYTNRINSKTPIPTQLERPGP